VDFLVLAGYMRIVTKELLKKFRKRVINIHPALLPSFPGLHGQRQAVEYGVKYSGCTVHFVDEGLDSGPIIAQRVVPVLDDDTEETLAARILEQEHQVLPEVLQWISEGRVHVDGRKVTIDK
jgi:phosphoribosylglycinamide formyltransferase-1